MLLKKYLILMIIATFVAWISLGAVIFTMSPEAGLLSLMLFYGTLFLSLLGSFFLLGFLFRYIFQRNIPLFRHLGISFRQGLLFTILVVGSLVLQAASYLRWWNLILFFIFLVILEFFFSLQKKNYGR
ncbi:MAG: hypothetical protein ABIH38_05460 [Patescibacteria group bacterium]